MSVITSISAGEFAASASRSAPRRPSASLARYDGTPKLFAYIWKSGLRSFEPESRPSNIRR